MSVPERPYEKYAWVLLFALAIILLILSLIIIVSPGGGGDPDFQPITGTTWDQLVDENPGVAQYISFVGRSLGSVLLGLALLGLAVSWKSYRVGERWAWYALWSFPLIFALALAFVLSAGGTSWPMWAALLVVALLGLLLPYRRFFLAS